MTVHLAYVCDRRLSSDGRTCGRPVRDRLAVHIDGNWYVADLCDQHRREETGAFSAMVERTGALPTSPPRTAHARTPRRGEPAAATTSR